MVAALHVTCLIQVDRMDDILVVGDVDWRPCIRSSSTTSGLPQADRPGCCWFFKDIVDSFCLRLRCGPLSVRLLSKVISARKDSLVRSVERERIYVWPPERRELKSCILEHDCNLIQPRLFRTQDLYAFLQHALLVAETWTHVDLGYVQSRGSEVGRTACLSSFG